MALPQEDGEQGLIEAAQRGDREAFARVYGRYRQALLGVCTGRLRNAALAEDIVQETFIKALLNLDSFDTNRRLWPWLVTIAQRRCIDATRRQSHVTSLEEASSSSSDEPAEWRESVVDSTLDAVLGGEARGELAAAIESLPPRQKRALLLHVLEGWDYSEIAFAESASVSSIKSLIFRARSQLRRVCESGTWGLVWLPVWRLRQRLTDAGHRVASVAGMAQAGLATSLEPLATAGLVLLIALQSGPAAAASAAAGAGAPHAHARYAAARLHSVETRSSGDVPGGTTPAPGGLNNVGGGAIDPAKDATPQRTTFDSVVASPGYRTDGTVFAAGLFPCAHVACPVLFASKDGGATWSRLIAKGLIGTQILLPPAYPADGRIFAMGLAGLQESSDGGASFSTLSPLPGGAAISPAFDSGDPRVLIATAPVLVEYWADRAVAKPAPLNLASKTDTTIAFAPDYASSHVLFLGSTTPNLMTRTIHPTIQRCENMVCRVIDLDGEGIPAMRLSPRFASDRRGLAFTRDGLFATSDGGRTFGSISMPMRVPNAIHDVAVAWDDRGQPVFLAGTSGLYRSAGAGEWVALSVPVQGFQVGAGHIIALPGGRLVAAGALTGLAFSDDAGSSWSEAAAAN